MIGTNTFRAAALAGLALLSESRVAIASPAPSAQLSVELGTGGVNVNANVGQQRPPLPDGSTTFWYPNLDHTTAHIRGFAPDLDGDFQYEVYKAVAAGDGGSIQSAINSATNGSTRHGQWFASQPRVVYIPPGEYIISETLRMNTDTILMGDPTNPPVLKAAAGFSGDQTLLSAQDPTTGISGELSFAVSLKNLVLDTTNIPGGQPFTALWWGVAQGAHLQNVKIRMPPAAGGQGHSGMRLGRGSTLGVSDLRVEGGQNGIWYDGHQQAAFKSIYFYKNAVAFFMTGGNTVTLIDSTFDNCGAGVLQTGGFPWIALIDTNSINSGVTLKTTTWPSYLIENLQKDTLDTDVIQGPGEFVLGPRNRVDRFSWANTVDRDPIYGPEPPNVAATRAKRQVQGPGSRPPILAPGGRYPAIPAPNYASLRASDFLNIKDPAQNGGRTVLGDNTRDESAALNAILALAASQGKVAYLPFGKYRVDSTLLIPRGTRLVGEAWATIVGFGSFFKDARNPKPVVQIGNPGDVGVAQLQDVRITVGDVLPGAILVQFHMAGARPGDVALWNSFVTVGGTRGAAPLAAACVNPARQCQAAFLGMHFAPTSSAYVENVWNWVADHIVEDYPGGTNIAAGRGALVEATKGTWLHALGSEHWWLYQLNYRNSANVLNTLLQSETNYDQGDNNPMIPPAPWTLDVAGWGDPSFNWCRADDKRCRMGPANFFNGGENIYTYGSASWTFFSGPGNPRPGCAATFECQQYMHLVEKTPKNLNAFGLCSKDAWVTLRLADGREMVTKDGFTGSWPGGGGDVGRYTPVE